MSVDETVLVGSLPPPITGQTIAFEMVCRGFEEQSLPFKVINLSGGAHLNVEGGFSFRRLRQLFRPFFKGLFLFLTGRRILYLSATQNWIGFCRDSIFILLARWRGNRVVIHIHGGNYNGFFASLSPLRRSIVRSVINRVDRILILGKSLYGMFDFEPGLRNKIRVVFNGLPYVERETAQVPKSLPLIQHGRPRILYLSNLIVSKGYLHVLEALRMLVHEKHIDVECHFCGSFVLSSEGCPFSSPEEAEADFLRRIEESELGVHAFWHGPVDGQEKLDFLNESQFFVLPTDMHEGQPISIIEALAFGMVVVTTTRGTIPEMLEQGKAGELIPFGRPDEIARVIESYIKEPLKYQAMSRASMERYREVFTREAHLDSLISSILSA